MLSRRNDLVALRERRPFRRRGLLWRTAVFPLTLLLAFALYPYGNPVYDTRFAVAAALALAFLPLATLTPWQRLPRPAQLLLPLLYVAVIALLRDAHGGAASGYAPFLLVTALCFALYGSRTDLVIGILATGLALAIPIFADAGSYPSGEWRRATGILLVGSVLGFTSQTLLGRLFREIDAHEETARRLRQAEAFVHDDVVQNLTVAKLAFALDDHDRAHSSVDRALTTVQRIVAQLLTSTHRSNGFTAGSLVREPPHEHQPREPPRSSA
jgi:signal transduction histidine kinase